MAQPAAVAAVAARVTLGAVARTALAFSSCVAGEEHWQQLAASLAAVGIARWCGSAVSQVLYTATAFQCAVDVVCFVVRNVSLLLLLLLPLLLLLLLVLLRLLLMMYLFM